MNMIQVKVSELTGAALDWAVADCEPDLTPHAMVEHDYGQGVHRPLERWVAIHLTPVDHMIYMPSTAWSQGGPIIERERINLEHRGSGACIAFRSEGIAPAWHMVGPTPLIAAMRCRVASVKGETVTVPAKLVGDEA